MHKEQTKQPLRRQMLGLEILKNDILEVILNSELMI